MNVDNLAGFFFLDTNILVYSFDKTAPAKQRIARQLLRHGLQTQRGVISTQVIQEFLNLATRKFSPPLVLPEAREYLQSTAVPLCQHFPSIAFYEQALLIQLETGYAWYDALIITAAIETNCATLLSEDLQDGQTIHGLTILNPFRASA
ncbi:MAG: PIN domain-containing protein [Caldilineaceae bacterium]|nr:PIN domain-containing protein [Caldilineaceae bacterium]